MRSEPKVEINRSAELIRGKCIAVNKIAACTKIKSTYTVFYVINDTSEMILAYIRLEIIVKYGLGRSLFRLTTVPEKGYTRDPECSTGKR